MRGTNGNIWSPGSLSLTPGSTVTFSWGPGAPHNLNIPGAYGPTSPSTSGSAAVTFPSPGTYQVICDVHAGEGMVATIFIQ